MKLVEIKDIRIGQIYKNIEDNLLYTIEWFENLNDFNEPNCIHFKAYNKDGSIFYDDFVESELKDGHYTNEFLNKSKYILVGFKGKTHEILKNNKLNTILRKEIEIGDLVYYDHSSHYCFGDENGDYEIENYDYDDGVVVDILGFKDFKKHQMREYFNENVEYNDFGYPTISEEEFYKQKHFDEENYTNEEKIYKILFMRTKSIIEMTRDEFKKTTIGHRDIPDEINCILGVNFDLIIN